MCAQPPPPYPRRSRLTTWRERPRGAAISYGNRQLIMLGIGVTLLLHWLSCLLGLVAQLMTPSRSDELQLAVQAQIAVDPTCTGCTPDIASTRGSLCFDFCLTPCESLKVRAPRLIEGGRGSWRE